ncbi:MAG: hypothetical protein Hals2KO_18410 [Halioglobus sp.]
MSYPAALKHDAPQQIAEDLFVVYGCVKMMMGMRLTRNMVIVRDQGKLTLINPVRMDESGLAALEALGEVAAVLRLGPFHGMDDAFYVDRYKVPFWSFEGGTTYTEPTIDHVLREGGELPFAGATLFAFAQMKEPEGALVLERGASNVLITCDAVQSYSTAPHTPHTSWLMRKMMPRIGFPCATLIGPFWMKLLVDDKQAMEKEFQRLLTFEFDQLIAAHGTFLPANAHRELELAFEKMFR